LSGQNVNSIARSLPKGKDIGVSISAIYRHVSAGHVSGPLGRYGVVDDAISAGGLLALLWQDVRNLEASHDAAAERGNIAAASAAAERAAKLRLAIADRFGSIDSEAVAEQLKVAEGVGSLLIRVALKDPALIENLARATAEHDEDFAASLWKISERAAELQKTETATVAA
jgi:hypothetical protein